VGSNPAWGMNARLCLTCRVVQSLRQCSFPVQGTPTALCRDTHFQIDGWDGHRPDGMVRQAERAEGSVV
jgi:hypothetical protein